MSVAFNRISHLNPEKAHPHIVSSKTTCGNCGLDLTERTGSIYSKQCNAQQKRYIFTEDRSVFMDARFAKCLALTSVSSNVHIVRR